MSGLFFLFSYPSVFSSVIQVWHFTPYQSVRKNVLYKSNVVQQKTNPITTFF